MKTHNTGGNRPPTCNALLHHQPPYSINFIHGLKKKMLSWHWSVVTNTCKPLHLPFYNVQLKKGVHAAIEEMSKQTIGQHFAIILLCNLW